MGAPPRWAYFRNVRIPRWFPGEPFAAGHGRPIVLQSPRGYCLSLTEPGKRFWALFTVRPVLLKQITSRP
jgi:hypothetical protein